MDVKASTLKKIQLPVRPITQIENPTPESLKSLDKSSIVKAVFTKRNKAGLEIAREALRKFDAFILIEQYPRKRTKVHLEKGMLEFSTEQLLKIYAKERKVDERLLLQGYELIN